MSKLFACLSLLAFASFASLAAASENPRPLGESELLALVVGHALPENIVHEITSRGLSFRPDEFYRSQLKTGGADAKILAALDTAKTGAARVPGNGTSKELLQHIATAGKLMKQKLYEQAANELAPTVTGNFESYEIGFVAGQLLRAQERWAEAAAVYMEVLRQAPEFPEAHAKLRLYRMGDGEGALREAKAAMAHYAQDAEAHKNAGLALDSLRQFDASIAEYREALRLKPDYEAVRLDLGLVLYNKGELDASIVEYKKALTLDANDADVHYNLAQVYDKKGDFASAIRENREAKRLAPDRLDVRQNLGSALIDASMYAEAIREFRELQAMAPDFQLCHLCLGIALRRTGDLEGAKKEYRKAAELDPSDAQPHLGLGFALEQQKDPDAALEEYRIAEQLDESLGRAHRCIGKILLDKKDISHALEELKQADNLDPTDWSVHDFYGQALQASGDTHAAIAQFRESLSLDERQFTVRIRLAGALEQSGEWPEALDQYRQVTASDNSGPSQNEYQAAQQRFKNHLDSLRKAGKLEEAPKLEERVRVAQANPGVSEKLNAAIQAGWDTFLQQPDASESSYKEALRLAESIQPRDPRLLTILNRLGMLYMRRGGFSDAQAMFERQIKIAQEIYGAQTIAIAEPLTSLGMNAIGQHDYASALNFYNRALDVNRQFYGETSKSFADALRSLSLIYIEQGQFDKAEPYLVRAVKIGDQLFGYDGEDPPINLWSLCGVYDRWNKPDKLEPCNRQMIAVLEKKYGANSPVLQQVLTGEAKTLRTLGRASEAVEVEKRLKSLQTAAAVNPN